MYFSGESGDFLEAVSLTARCSLNHPPIPDNFPPLAGSMLAEPGRRKVLILAISEYASGEYRLCDSARLSERVRLGVGAGVASASRRDTVADNGCYAGVGGGTGAGTAQAAAERGEEAAHHRGKLPRRRAGHGAGAPPRFGTTASGCRCAPSAWSEADSPGLQRRAGGIDQRGAARLSSNGGNLAGGRRQDHWAQVDAHNAIPQPPAEISLDEVKRIHM